MLRAFRSYPSREVPVLDHLSIPTRDTAASADFYGSVFAPLGAQVIMRFPRGDGEVVGLGGPDGKPSFWLGAGPPSGELHIAFVAPDRSSVDAVHAAAVDRGAEILHAPRVWPEYHPSYYAVFVRDPDGHNVEAVCHT
ncbi:catechol 2,3-dioxygenase-like lactoylglutathione lyase family enzyme [Pseudonocardia endophytica]|uniref:Catechol 2,3-dioxygenase-like lactoylglutathione lyase family enzyme n=2 Tax=Pseudonocardia endophytica TaxID=401976 RepID=A0A4R1HDN4_PSEEN|nr:catechol 2,3-dioxygenase-like lactoylglutathione lyase family enzyme [Pseudonocardia endophytica]